MSRFQHVAAKLLLPVCALCLLGLDFGRAQDAGSSPARQGGTIASSVNIEVDGQVLAVHMAGGDVAEALKVAGVELGEEDECSPAPGEAIAPNMTITVRRVCTRTVVQQEPIRARTRVIPTRQLRAGITCIKQHPEDGLKELTYRVTWRDGEVASRELLDARVVRPVKDKLILVGGGGPEAALPRRLLQWPACHENGGDRLPRHGDRHGPHLPGPESRARYCGGRPAGDPTGCSRACRGLWRGARRRYRQRHQG
ncbi:MAG: DUF348 domain-containing protein [Armatimonadetes bacterium]|nr:DUF348 domain-containing protein [Armatimonadota bacterium]